MQLLLNNIAGEEAMMHRINLNRHNTKPSDVCRSSLTSLTRDVIKANTVNVSVVALPRSETADLLTWSPVSNYCKVKKKKKQSASTSWSLLCEKITLPSWNNSLKNSLNLHQIMKWKNTLVIKQASHTSDLHNVSSLLVWCIQTSFAFVDEWNGATPHREVRRIIFYWNV